MRMSKAANRHKREFLLILGVWTAYAFFFAGDLIIGRAYDGRPLMAARTVVEWLVCGYVWAALTPLVLAAVPRFPFDKQNPLRSVAIHTLVSAITAFFQPTVYFAA